MRIENISFSTYGRLEMRGRDFSSHIGGISKIYYINEGSMEYRHQDKITVFQKGHLYLIPQNIDSDYRADYVDNTFIDFYSTPGIVMDKFLDIELSKYPLIESVFTTLNYLVSRYPMWELDQEFVFHEIIKSTLINLITLIDEEFGISTITDETIRKAIEYVHANYSQKISVTDLAEKYHIDRSAFIRRFKKFTQVTPYQYIKSLRVNTALELIKTGDYTLADIAEIVGYSDAASLSHSIAKLGLKENV